MSKSTRQIGNEGENIACKYLIKKGLIVLSRNYYSGHSEIDIIAKDGEIYVFVEVKMRSSTKFGQPEEFVSDLKVDHVFKAAEAWVIENGLNDVPMRFDVIGIVNRKNNPKIVHLLDAFR